ncbi:helix-turn-helix domain-containing protein [Yinghuangia sp. YIM S09857]|uniref:helix-turn-helix domain-containing protein n=1 Tax=Yinghuangia sp. YIM S09857 TaxID=3436929 RepID=UPI003F536E05
MSPRHEVVQVPPHPRLRPGVQIYRGFRIHAGHPRERLELPVGFVTLLLGFDQRITIGSVGTDLAADPVGAGSQTFTSLLAGMRTSSVIGVHSGSVHGIEVVMRPWAAYAMFGVPMHELTESLVDPSDVAGGAVRRLVDRLAEIPDWPTRFTELDRSLLHRVENGPTPAPRVLRAWDLLVGSAGATPISGLSRELGWSERQLERMFREQLGLAPKAAARVLRLQHALRLLVADRPLAEIASRAGFYDQSHLNREIRAATGMTPGAFLNRIRQAPTATARVDGTVTTLVLQA